jgi:tetratricopeptide (TPR) repeat protein
MGIEDSLDEIKKLMEQGHHHHERGQHRLALQYYQKAIPLAATLGDGGIMAVLLAHAAGEHRDCDNYHHAIDLLVAALTLLPAMEDTIAMRAQIKKLLAITLTDVFGPYKPEVLELLRESRADYALLGYAGQEANVLQHIGGVHTQTKRFVEADNALREALQKARSVGDEQLVGWILDSMADLEIERDDWGTALELSREARVKARSVQDMEAEGDTWINEGRILLRMGQPEAALAAVEKALSIYTENQNLRRTIRARRHIAKVQVKMDKVNEATEALKLAMDTAARLDLRHDQALLQLDLGQIELSRKNYTLACEYAARARARAEEEDLPDLFDQADDLLYRCREEERRNE